MRLSPISKQNLVRKCEIADQIPLIAQKLAEKLPQGAIPAIAVRFAKSFFHAKQVGFFVPLCFPEYTLEVDVDFPADWQRKIRIKADAGLDGSVIAEQGEEREKPISAVEDPADEDATSEFPLGTPGGVLEH